LLIDTSRLSILRNHKYQQFAVSANKEMF